MKNLLPIALCVCLATLPVRNTFGEGTERTVSPDCSAFAGNIIRIGTVIV